MSQNLVIPAYLQAMLANNEVQSNIEGTAVASDGILRISTKGKVFRFKEGDEETKKGQAIDVIIVGMTPEFGLSHTFYAEGYTPDASAPPDCSSASGKEPDHWIASPQSKSCLTCPKAVWGSAKSMSGGKSKACKDSKVLHVIEASDVQADKKVWMLSVTVNSLKNFTHFGKELAAKGIPSTALVFTRISMNDEASVPQLEFTILGIINEETHNLTKDVVTEKPWDSRVKQLAAPAAVIESTVSDEDVLDAW